MAALQAGDGSHHGEVIGVEHFDLGTVREINAARGGIYGDVIEILAAPRGPAQRDFL